MYSPQEILKILDAFAPLDICDDWDNSGLLVNSMRDINKIMICLDITNAVISEAAQKECELIVSHHPIIFNAIKKIDASSPVYALIKHDISAICMHTCLDKAQGGVNDILAQKLGLIKVFNMPTFGRIGLLKADMPFTELAVLVQQVLGTTVKTVAVQNKISCVAVVGGSGTEFLEQAKDLGADCLITGDAGYHDAQKARELDISLIAAGHYATERPVCEVLSNILKAKCPLADVIMSQKGKDFFD